MFSQSRKLAFCFVLGIILFIPVFTQAVWSNTADFYVESDYDFFGRDKIEAQLIKTTNKIYFYADKNWYNGFSQKSELDSKIYNLSSSFEYKIYPTLTNLLGSEDNPGVDNDSRIIVVFEPLKQSFGGYIRTGDHYLKEGFSLSNQGQIIYLNANLIVQSSLDFLSYELAHEFTHLITLKQKSEAETWFYELMSEFAGQSIGVDTSQVTKKRAQSLLYLTEINLKDWKNSDKDYGEVYLLSLYLKEQFGNQIFANTLKYPSKDGIISFNEAFKQLGINYSFDDIYLNWLIANLINNCQNSLQYCYQDSALKDYSAIAYSYYLPMQAKSTLSVTDSISAWEGKWQKITGGSGSIKLKFTIPEDTPISKIPYIIEDNQGKKTLGFLDFTSTNIQEIYVNDMGSGNTAVYFIPFIGSQAQENKLYYYSFEAQNLGNSSETEEQVIQNLLQRIAELKRKIANLQLQLAMMKTNQSNSYCAVFSGDLYYGMNSSEVKCLQQFLTNLGPKIYPEALVTGYFGPLTRAAVKRYQALQGIITTGYFGPLTRAAVNNKL
jgi:peptidoglycan hydrolase-like protein with peptidoglycan-binding domain